MFQLNFTEIELNLISHKEQNSSSSSHALLDAGKTQKLVTQVTMAT